MYRACSCKTVALCILRCTEHACQNRLLCAYFAALKMEIKTPDCSVHSSLYRAYIRAKALVRCAIAQTDRPLCCSLCILYTLSGPYCLASSVPVVFSRRGPIRVQKNNKIRLKKKKKEEKMMNSKYAIFIGKGHQCPHQGHQCPHPNQLFKQLSWCSFYMNISKTNFYPFYHSCILL